MIDTMEKSRPSCMCLIDYFLHKNWSSEWVSAEDGAEEARESFTGLHGLLRGLEEDYHVYIAPHIVVY